MTTRNPQRRGVQRPFQPVCVSSQKITHTTKGKVNIGTQIVLQVCKTALHFRRNDKQRIQKKALNCCAPFLLVVSNAKRGVLLFGLIVFPADSLPAENAGTMNENENVHRLAILDLRPTLPNLSSVRPSIPSVVDACCHRLRDAVDVWNAFGGKTTSHPLRRTLHFWKIEG